MRGRSSFEEVIEERLVVEGCALSRVGHLLLWLDFGSDGGLGHVVLQEAHSRRRELEAREVELRNIALYTR